MGCAVSTLDERVAAGAAFLDERYPGWVERIDLDGLEMDDCANCIIGQAVGNYFDLFRMPDQDDRAASLGFNTEAEEHPWDMGRLEHAWRRLIEARRTS